MTIMTFTRKQLEKAIGPVSSKVEHEISMFGTPIDSVSDDSISIEVFPNRPDLLSFQGWVRSFLSYRGKKTGLRQYIVHKPEKDFVVTIDRSVKKVRPFTACAIVKGLQLDSLSLADIIDMQEKIHKTYGRDRKKVAIGMYPLEKITLPITFCARKPNMISFIPLEESKAMTGKQILAKHNTGKTYAHLLKGCEVFPVFEDASGAVLSMPPIINSGTVGKIDEKTTDVFVECSGFDYDYLERCLSIILCALSDMGGKIYGVTLEDGKKKRCISLEALRMKFSYSQINTTLGLELSEKDIRRYLERMGIGVDTGEALIPSYRTDMLHEVDLSEEVAIAYGFDNFIPELPAVATVGEEHRMTMLQRTIAQTLIGLELLEISTFHLSTKDAQFKKRGIRDYKSKVIEVENSKTEHSILRHSLFAQGLHVLSENSGSLYPQKIFEIGTVFFHDEKSKTGIGESERLSVSLCGEDMHYTEIKQVLDYLMRMFSVSYSIIEIEDPSFISGRCGGIVVNGSSIGIIGEVSPTVLKHNKLLMPVASFEIDIVSFLQ